MNRGVLSRGVFATALLVSSLQAGTTTITVGSPAASGTGNCDPFGCPAFLGLGTYQQVYASTAFSGPLAIGKVVFLNTQVLNNGKHAQGTFTVSFAYTSKPVGGLDLTNPQNNITSGSQTFFSGALPSLVSGPGGIRLMPLTGTSFPYDPSNGNLIMTIIVASPVDGEPYLSLDEAATTVQTTNAYFGTAGNGGNTAGLVTEFETMPLAISSPTSLAAAMVGTSYGPVTFTATGGAGGYTWSATGLPGGITFSLQGLLSGTPLAGSQGNYNPQFTVTDSSNSTANVTLALVVDQGPLQITGPSALPPGAVAETYGPVTFTATGGAGGYTWSATSLPSGLTFSTSGFLSGTPRSQGSFNPQFTVMDAGGANTSVTLSLSITVATLQITAPTSLAAGNVGESYGPVNFTAMGGTGGYVWSATGLPSGLSISSSGGVLSGTPATGSQGTYNPKFTVKDSNSHTATVTLALVINSSTLEITGPTSLAAGTVGASYGPVDFTASGGTGGYSWTAFGLPGGLSITAAGVLSGTPATGTQGTYFPQFTVTDSSSHTASATLALVLNPAQLQVTAPTSLAAGTVGSSYSPVTFTATGGTGGYSWTATGLPSGLGITAAGVLSGTPAIGSRGSYNPQFTVTDSSSHTANVVLALVINTATFQITAPTSLSAGTVGASYGPVTFAATGGTGGYVWAATGLPGGLSFTSAGVLSGTPATGTQGSYNPQFKVTDSSNHTASVTLALTINPVLQITAPTSLAAGTVGTSYGPVTFTATGGTGGYSWTATGLPSGLSITAAGVLSGTPATGTQGIYNPQFTVTDSSNHTVTVTLALTINPATLQITAPTSLSAGTVGTSYGPVTFTATGGTGGYSWTATGLPRGLTITAAGVLSGTPATGTQGNYNPQFTVTDSSNHTAIVTLALVINPATLQITSPTSLAAGTVGVSYGSVTFTVSGGAGGYSWAATGLPKGLKFSAQGVLSGTPAAGSQGSYNPQFTVTDSSQNMTSVTLALVINPAALQVSGPTSLAAGTVGVSYTSVKFTATGGTRGKTWSATGLPSGLSMSTAGVLSGTPAAGTEGNYNPEFTVTDSASQTANVTLALVIGTAPLQITSPASLHSGTVLVSYAAVHFAATGGTGTYTWSATGLPRGMGISPGGVLGGTPAAGSEGSYSPQFTVKDSNNSTASVTLTLVIGTATLQITGPTSLSNGLVGVAYVTVTFTASGGTGVYRWSATGLPNGLSMSTSGLLGGTPAAGSEGNYNPVFTVTDSNQNTANATLTLVIGTAPLQIVAPTSLPNGTVGASYPTVKFTAAGGTGVYTWSVTALPSGMTFTSGGSLAGTPASGTQGTYNPMFTVTDSNNNTANVTLQLVINPAALQITGPTSLSAGTVGVSYGPVTFTATGGTGSYVWTATGLPSGLSISTAGVLSGTPATGSQGSYNPQFTVTDSSNHTTSVTLALNINAAPLQITAPTSLSAGTVGSSYGPVTFTATGGTGSYAWTATGLPSGLSISTAGVLSGTPASGSQGSYNPQFTVTDSSNHTTSVTLALTINAALQITAPTSLSAGTVGSSYGPVTFTATGGTGGYSWTATGLPSGLSITATGVLSGTPAVGSQGSYSPQFTVTDSSNHTTSVTLALTINPAALQITAPTSLSAGMVGLAYGPVAFTATGGTGGYSWTATGLPSGLGITTAGVLSGMPLMAGSYNPQFTVMDSSNNMASVTLALVIMPQPLMITGPASLSAGMEGASYGPVSFTATGGTGGYSWTASGLPSGLSISTDGTLSGTPDIGSAGSYNPQFTVTDSSNNMASVTLALVINPATLQITEPTSLADGNEGVAYGPVSFTAVGGTGGYVWTATGLPSGLSISSDGTLSGTPTVGSAGSYNPQFTVTDSSQNTTSVTLSLNIDP